MVGTVALHRPFARLSVRLVALDVADLRIAGILACAASVLLPLAPGYDGITCPLRMATGIPCPLCGLTTSVRATLSLDLRGAAAANPAGLAVVAGAVALLFMRGRLITLPTFAIPFALIALWVFEMLRFNVL